MKKVTVLNIQTGFTPIYFIKYIFKFIIQLVTINNSVYVYMNNFISKEEYEKLPAMKQKLYKKCSFEHQAIQLGKYVYEAVLNGGTKKTEKTKWARNLPSTTTVKPLEISISEEDYDYLLEYYNSNLDEAYSPLMAMMAKISRVFIPNFLHKKIYKKPKENKFFCSHFVLMAFYRRGLIPVTINPRNFSPNMAVLLLNTLQGSFFLNDENN